MTLQKLAIGSLDMALAQFRAMFQSGVWLPTYVAGESNTYLQVYADLFGVDESQLADMMAQQEARL